MAYSTDVTGLILLESHQVSYFSLVFVHGTLFSLIFIKKFQFFLLSIACFSSFSPKRLDLSLHCTAHYLFCLVNDHVLKLSFLSGNAYFKEK